jgi:hypothetical protein
MAVVRVLVTRTRRVCSDLTKNRSLGESVGGWDKKCELNILLGYE